MMVKKDARLSVFDSVDKHSEFVCPHCQRLTTLRPSSPSWHEHAMIFIWLCWRRYLSLPTSQCCAARRTMWDVWRCFSLAFCPSLSTSPVPVLYYRKRGSVSYIVREWLLWVVERERETPVTSIDITLKSRVIMHMITSTARRPNASTRSEPVECSSACKD